MKDISFIAKEYPDLGYDRHYTFAGVLIRFFVVIDPLGNNVGLSKEWQQTTSEQYVRDYTERLLPAMAQLFGKEKPLYTYTEDDFEAILNNLRAKYHYSVSTMMHYRHLLWIVYKAGYEAGLYVDNVFWGEFTDPTASPKKYEEHRAKALTRIRKSFSIREEIRILKWFSQLDPLTSSGTEIGLACMFFLGCRNNEACGADFSAFHALSGYPDTGVFDMLQTTSENSNRVKGSGKTPNAPRTLPCPHAFYSFIMKRREGLEQLIEKGTIVLPDDVQSVDQLPVTCVGNKYTERAQTGDLSRAGRELFTSIGIGKSELAILHEILQSEEFRETQIEEKDPTTYLLRRNVATRLYHLGFPWTTIQYWIAHEVEDTLLMRNHFADEDTLYAIGQQYGKHPAFRALKKLLGKENREMNQQMMSLRPKETLWVKTVTLEPNQPINFRIRSSRGDFKIHLTEFPEATPCSNEVDILGALDLAYQENLELQAD